MSPAYGDPDGDMSAETVSALVRRAGVPSVDVKVDGSTLKGCRREAVDAALGVAAVAVSAVPALWPQGRGAGQVRPASVRRSARPQERRPGTTSSDPPLTCVRIRPYQSRM